MPNAIIFDIEATDKDNPVLIEAAWVALDSISPFTLGEEFHQRYNPGKPISLGALATHHILDEELVDCPPASSFTLPADATYLIGHNIDFDWSAIGQPDIKRICTLALSRILLRSRSRARHTAQRTFRPSRYTHLRHHFGSPVPRIKNH